MIPASTLRRQRPYFTSTETILYVHRDHTLRQQRPYFTSTETILYVHRDHTLRPQGPYFTSTETILYVHRDHTLRPQGPYFTSTETIRTVRDEEPRTSTSTFTQLLSSDLVRYGPYVFIPYYLVTCVLNWCIRVFLMYDSS